MKCNLKLITSKNIFVFLLLSVSSISFSQTSLSLDYDYKYGSYILKPTWSNLKKLITCKNVVFEKTMEKYNYELTVDKSAYIASNDVGAPYFTINKKYGEVLMYFQEKSNYIDNLIEKLSGLLNTGPRNINGLLTFTFSFMEDGIKYNCKVQIHDNFNGVATVILEYF